MKEAERQINDSSTYKEVKVTEKDCVDLVAKSNKIFANLETKKRHYSAEGENYLKLIFIKATSIGKIYLLPKIHKVLVKFQDTR